MNPNCIDAKDFIKNYEIDKDLAFELLEKHFEDDEIDDIKREISQIEEQ